MKAKVVSRVFINPLQVSFIGLLFISNKLVFLCFMVWAFIFVPQGLANDCGATSTQSEFPPGLLDVAEVDQVPCYDKPAGASSSVGAQNAAPPIAVPQATMAGQAASHEDARNAELDAAHASTARKAEAEKHAKRMIQIEKKRLSGAIGRVEEVGRSGNSQDGSIVERVLTIYKDDKPIPSKLAKQAQDPAIREDLLVAAYAQEARRRAEKESARLSEQIAGLAGLAARALHVGQALNSLDSKVPVPGGQDLNSSKPSGRALASMSQQGSITAEGEKKPVSDGDRAQATGGLKEEEINKLKELIAKAKDGKTKNGLRDRLRKLLAASDKSDKSGSADDHFNGKLTRDLAQQAGQLGGAAGIDAAGANALKDVLRASQGELDGEGAASQGSGGMGGAHGSDSGSDSRFTLAGAETDAAVQKLTAEAEGALLGSSDPSIQAMDSVSLFERVHSVHHNCLKQGCVKVK